MIPTEYGLVFTMILIIGILTLLSHVYHSRIKLYNCKQFKAVSLVSVAICIILALSFYMVINKPSTNTNDIKEELITWITTIIV